MSLKSPDFKQLEKAFNGDLDLALFFLSWVKNGRNATQAYIELNPKVDRNSAQVLGSRQLAKIDRQAVMKSYGLDTERYFTQLDEGLKALKSDMIGQTFPDHKTRAIYHDKLGKLLGIENDKGNGSSNTIQILVMPTQLIEKYDISSKPSDSSE